MSDLFARDLAEGRRIRRNLNPHQEARLAILVLGREYAAQGGGSMDFWDGLPDSRKRLVREMLDAIHKCPREAHEQKQDRCRPLPDDHRQGHGSRMRA